MEKLEKVKLEEMKEVVYANYRFGRYWGKYLIKYSFAYTLFIFILFKAGIIKDTFLLNWISDLFSYFIPLIDAYAHQYHYYAAANLYSLSVLGLLFFTYKTFSKNQQLFIPLIGDFKNKLKTIAFRIFCFLLFGGFLLIGFSEIFVSVQYSCPATYEMNRVCMGMQGTPATNNFSVLLLLGINALFWSLLISGLIITLVPKDIRRQYPNQSM